MATINVSLDIPQTDLSFLKEFVDKMGWAIAYHPNSPKSIKDEEVNDFNIPDDIMSLVGIASGISEDEIEMDSRLSYLLQK